KSPAPGCAGKATGRVPWFRWKAGRSKPIFPAEERLHPTDIHCVPAQPACDKPRRLSFMQQKNQFQNGYTFNRIINGCWQLSAEHCLQGRLDVKDALRAFHMLVDQGFTTFDCADIYTGV